MDPRELPQIKEWLAGDEPFHPIGFVMANCSVAEAVTLAMIFWPEFVEYRGGVFLKWAFIQRNVDTWFDEAGDDRSRVEVVVNHLHFWDAFSLKRAEDYLAVSALAVKVASMWRAALRESFPGREFDVMLTDQTNDYGPTVTFRSLN